MEHLERDVGGVRGLFEPVRHGRQRDTHAARSRSGDAGKGGDGNGFVDERIGDGLKCLFDGNKPGSAAMTAPKPYSEAVLIEARSAPLTASLVPSANFDAMVLNEKITT